MTAGPAGRRVVLGRGCEALLVPSGQAVTIPEGTEAVVVQSLGRSVTVQTDRGWLARIDGHELDALGLGSEELGSGEPARDAPVDGEPLSADRVLEALRAVYDPEIPINVVDLGLVYACELTALRDGRQRVEVKMSMTAPGCGMGDVLRQEAIQTISALPGVGEVGVELVWDPPWDLSRLSEDARLQLGMW